MFSIVSQCLNNLSINLAASINSVLNFGEATTSLFTFESGIEPLTQTIRSLVNTAERQTDRGASGRENVEVFQT